MLNTADTTGQTRELLTDFAMDYAPFRNENLDERQLTHDSLMQALAVMHTAQPYANTGMRSRKLNYTAIDRGVI